MTMLTDGTGATYSDKTFQEAAQMIWLSNHENLADKPSNFTILTSSMLNFSGGGLNGSMDSDGYFRASSLSDAPGGDAVAVLTDDGRILLTFAGTNETLDTLAIYHYRDKSYVNGFKSYLQAIADYATANGYLIDLVTGKSLGGAATNILRDRADIAGGAFASAKYFGVASPFIADTTTAIINFGYDNDYAYEFFEETFDGGDQNFATGPENMILYNAEYASSGWTQVNEMSAHAYKYFNAGLTAVLDNMFESEITQDSFVVIGATDAYTIDMALAQSRHGISTSVSYFLGKREYFKDTVKGTSGVDKMDLYKGDDTAYGNGGNDVIYGGGGADTLYGGEGDDLLDGGGYLDKLYGEAGNDKIYGGDDADIIFGGTGNDTIDGGRGNDNLNGDEGFDFIYGGDGNDQIHGGAGNDRIYSGAGNDIVWGDAWGDLVYLEDGDDIFYDDANITKFDRDTVSGGNGNDKLYGGGSNDKLSGDAGNDWISGGHGSDYLTGGIGLDTFVFSNQGHDVIFDFSVLEDILDISAISDYAISETDSGLLFSFNAENDILLKNLTMGDVSNIHFA